MNISNINNFINVKNNILKCFVHEVAQATDVSVAVARIYRWRNEVFRRHVAQAKGIFITWEERYMYFNISDIKTYNIDESYKQCFSNIKNSVEYSLAIDYMLERFDKNIVKEICLFLYKFKFATKKQIINGGYLQWT